jgi:hypothetical protein
MVSAAAYGEKRMRLRKLTCLLAATLCLLFGVSPATSQTPQQQSSIKTAPAEEWQVYELGKGAFTVLLPSKPIESMKAADTSETYVYTAEISAGLLISNFSLLSEEAEKWPESRNQPFYQGFWEGISGGFNEQFKKQKLDVTMKLDEQRQATLDGHTGLEFLFSVGPKRGRLLITKVGRRAFSAMIFGTDTISSEAQEKYLSSFKIKPSS